MITYIIQKYINEPGLMTTITEELDLFSMCAPVQKNKQ